MERNKKWLDLCQSASTEQDPKKLMALVSEIVKALQDRDRKTGPVAVNMQRDAGHTLPVTGEHNRNSMFGRISQSELRRLLIVTQLRS
jgi:hypothetical protein